MPNDLVSAGATRLKGLFDVQKWSASSRRFGSNLAATGLSRSNRLFRSPRKRAICACSMRLGLPGCDGLRGTRFDDGLLMPPVVAASL